jgi:hypothetical protein
LAILRSKNIVITDCSVTGNTAPLGGGLASDSSAVELLGVNMTGNSAQVAADDGGGEVR